MAYRHWNSKASSTALLLSVVALVSALSYCLAYAAEVGTCYQGLNQETDYKCVNKAFCVDEGCVSIGQAQSDLCPYGGDWRYTEVSAANRIQVGACTGHTGEECNYCGKGCCAKGTAYVDAHDTPIYIPGVGTVAVRFCLTSCGLIGYSYVSGCL